MFVGFGIIEWFFFEVGFDEIEFGLDVVFVDLLYGEVW